MTKTVSPYRVKPRPKLRSNPRLSDRGREVLDPTSEVAPIGLRPMTDFERLQRLVSHGQRMSNFLPDDDFSDEDDFHENLEDLPPEGLTPYEIVEMRQKPIRKPVQKSSAAPAPTPPPAEQTPPGGGVLEQ